MGKQWIIGLIFGMISLLARAGDGEYAVSRITPAMRVNANAVLRLEEINFNIISTRETVLTNHYVITILNENGDHWAEFAQPYNKLRDIESVEGILYDATGRQLKKVKKKDMQDMSGVADGSLIDDTRYRSHNFYYKAYPYTVEYTVELRNRASLFFPSWVPQGKEALSVEKSSMRITCHGDYQLRYKAFRYDKEPVIEEGKNTRTLIWSAFMMPAITREPYSPLWHELTTVVIFGPTEFQIEGYKGNMATWQDFGKFVYALKEGRSQLPDNIRQEIHSIADGIKTPAEKIARLYEYMQKNTRYISIQLGLGGWQPFDATYVATKRYGDCKALTNYMYSILREAGIPSYYTLVRAGRDATYLTTDFPSQQFNHVILCVPLINDTVWLECTSQTLAAGYLGEFTAGRYALLIDENGGKLVRTPAYGRSENLQVRRVNATLAEDGTLKVKADSRYAALQQDAVHDMINALSPDKVKEYLHEQLNFATYDINDFKYNEQGGTIPSIEEWLDITVSNYATVTGKRLFINPNIMTRSGRKFSPDSLRRYDIQLGVEYRNIDSVEIDLPAGYRPEALPPSVTVNSPFGKYSSLVSLKANKLYYNRSIEYFSGRYPAKEYGELVKFYDAIYKADRNSVVLIKADAAPKAF